MESVSTYWKTVDFTIPETSEDAKAFPLGISQGMIDLITISYRKLSGGLQPKSVDKNSTIHMAKEESTANWNIDIV